jgi:chromosome segregation ATPase
LQSSISTNNILHNKIDKAEKEHFKHYSEVKDSETKKKENKKKFETEIVQLQDQVKALNKSNKLKDKEIHDLSKHGENARDTIKNLKSEKSTLKISKSKLESEVKKFQNKLAKKKPNSMKETQTDLDLVSKETQTDLDLVSTNPTPPWSNTTKL